MHDVVQRQNPYNWIRFDNMREKSDVDVKSLFKMKISI